MAPSLLHPPSHLSPGDALQLSQQAPAVLKASPPSTSSAPFQALFAASETPELWLTYENLLLSCLRTGDEKSAHDCLQRLVARFGDDNERLMALTGLVKEAEAENHDALEGILKDYSQFLSANSTNIPIAKRRIALLRSLGRSSEAITSLIDLLDFSPTDAEAWAELGDIYFSQGMYTQAIYALEETLIMSPNAWNTHARLAEVQYLAAKLSGTSDSTSRNHLAESVKRFCRSIELCDDYLRGYYGLKLVTTYIIQEVPKGGKQGDIEGWSLPDSPTLEKLNERATEKLTEIVRRFRNKEVGWRGYQDAEIGAAQELLARDEAQPAR